MAALQYVDRPGYAALLLRRTYADLSLPGALMDRAQDWFSGTGARWHDTEKTWEFPKGGRITFGYLETERDKYRYQGAEFSFLGWDELTQFSETQYTYLLSRLRRLEGSNVPLRVRAASNPGGVGHEWVRQRFLIEGEEAGRPFIPARLEDNPHLDQAAYESSLALLDPVTRAQLRFGDWDALPAGGMFQRAWFLPAERALPETAEWIRYWDKAATAGGTGARSAGVLLARLGKRYLVADVVKGRWNTADREAIILATAHADRARFGHVATWVEQEPGSGGKESAELTIERLAGFPVFAERVTGDKVSRATPLVAQASVGNVKIIEAAWNGEFLAEAEAFPQGLKDQVDASSGAFNKLALPSEVNPLAGLLGQAVVRGWMPR